MAPNFLLLLPDQHRPDWMAYVSPELALATPNIDRIAAEGTSFSRAYCTSPLCAPSRASLASGRHYSRCGVPNNHSDYPLDQPTYYQALRDAGYRVAGVGKFDLHKDTSDFANLDWHLDGSRLLGEWGFTEGIDNEGKIDGSMSYRMSGGPRGPYLKFLQDRGLADEYVAEHARIRENMGAYTTALPDDAYCDNWISENGLRFLRDFPPGTPWHLVVNFTGPHGPMDVTESMRERWADVDFAPPHRPSPDADAKGLLRNRQNYAAMIENIDRQIGRFIDTVEDRGELDNTIIVYSSDHGEMLGDHGRFGKSIWREASARIPLIVRGPGIEAAASSSALVSLHDVAATFLDYADVASLPAADAVSMRNLLEGSTATHRDVAVSGLDHWRMATDGRYKLVLQDGVAPMLFDLERDPWEDDDIADKEPERVTELSKRIV